MHSPVDFLSHESGASLDPVIFDIPSLLLHYKSFIIVGTFDHIAVLTRFVIDVGEANKKNEDPLAVGKNWEAAKADLQNTDSGILLQGSIDNQVNRLTNRLLDIQKKVCSS